MTKYRCPHCGSKAFSTLDRLYIGYINLGVPHRYHRGYGYRDGCRCVSCSQFSMQEKENVMVEILFFLNRIAYGYPVVPTVVTGLYFLGVLHWIFAVIAWVYWLAFLVYIVVYSLRKPLRPYPNESFFYENPILLKAETQVKINNAKYIKPYEVYGLKFKHEDLNGEIKQAFSDGMVPAVFHLNQKGSLTYDVRIINKSAVPKELLENGSKFLVEDADGIFIAKGTIEKSELDY